MNLLEGLRIAITALGANKMRSVLTTLGVVIGVAAVIAMVALGAGAQKGVQERIASMGSNLIFVVPGQAERGHIWRGIGSAKTLTIDEARRMRHEVPEVAGTAPEVSRNVQIKHGNKNGDFSVMGTFADYTFVRNAQFEEGRFFTALEEQSRRRVCVLGYEVWTKLFGENYAVGKTVKVKGVPFTVVGVLAQKGGFGREDTRVFIPMSVMRQRFSGDKYVAMIAVAGRDGVPLPQVEKAVRKWLRREHRLSNGQEDNFSISTQQDMLSTMEESNRIFTVLLAGIASISLLVGGIGIMNIMLVTVTERTREIGIRKAVGARRRDIELQFVVESTVLSVFGGLIGVLIGVLTARVVDVKFGIATVVSPSSVLLAFGCAAAIGIFFGYYPARQAGRLDPIQALRYE